MHFLAKPNALRCLIAAVLICTVCGGGPTQAQTPLDPATLTKYLDPLPNPLGNVISPTGTLDGMDYYEVSISQFTQQLHSELPPTTLWGYNGTYPGPTFDVQRGVPIKVKWTNDLVDGTGAPLVHHLLPYDSTVHGAGTEFPEVRVVTHLHGGVVEPESDGFPEYWYTADPAAPANGMGGPAGNYIVDTYHNQQPAATLWYHDHGMGITRLNVYAGLAGFYLVRDDQETALNLPSGDFEVPLVLQDRSFYDDGQLYYPRGPGDLTDPGGADPLAGLPIDFPSDASVVPHFFGNTNLVNGVVWPYMDVEPRKYRFRILNGSNSRFYDLQLPVGSPDPQAETQLAFHQIGTEGGLLSETTDRNHVLMAPAERADVIVDFSGLDGQDVYMLNLGPDGSFQYPQAAYDPADLNTTGQVMKFHVGTLTGPDTSSLPSTLVSVPRIPQSEAVATRQLSLVEDVDEFGRPKLLLDGAKWTDPTTELPLKGTTEIWEITNSTDNSHPIHLHLVQFQVLDRTSRLLGEIPIEPYELGWKDTVMVNRSETVRVIAHFEDFEGLYVWHCHILEHEDHEMMRRYEVVPGPELEVEQGVTLALNDPHSVPPGYILTVDGTLTTPQLEVEGLLQGTGEVVSTMSNSGIVSPGGDAAGNLTISGEVTMLGSGKLAIELFGKGAGQFDTLDVGGPATLSGALSVDVFDIGQGGTYTPAPGDVFEILTAAGGVAGTFDLDLRTKLDGGLDLEVQYSSDSVALLVTSALAGDYNNDGSVDAADYTLWRDNLGAAAGTLPNDTDGGPIGSAQYATWKTNFGASLPLSTSQPFAAVPEPGSALLWAIALVTISCCGLCRRTPLATTMAAAVADRTKAKLKLLVALLAVGAVSTAGEVAATMVTLSPSKDNTLYETLDGSQSNGAGSYMFAGRTDPTRSNRIMRSVMAFDIASEVPAGSMIQSVTLTLQMSRTQVADPMPFVLHRLTSDWGEGTSNANGQEGAGKAPTTNDATWLHNFYPEGFWTTPGGDYDLTTSGSTSVGPIGSYSWGSTTQMVNDVQGWLDTPANNFGWLLMGPEGEQSAKRFDTKENMDAALRPSLLIEFTSGGPEIFNWIGMGSGGSFNDDNNWDTGFAPSSSTDTVNLVNTALTDQVATLNNSVTIDDLTIDGNTNAMSLSIGQGLAANVGDLQIGSQGGLAVELANGASGHLNASGPATLAGTVTLSTPGSTPAPTDSFEFLTYASRTGRFDSITGQEIEPGRSFSLHYNDSRALAIAGEWAVSGEELSGEIEVPQELLVSGAWDWNGTLIKRGDGELVLDLDGGFSTGAGAALAIVDGSVRLHGTGQTLSLDSLTYGELGLLSGNAALAGEYGWYGKVAVPEPSVLVLVAAGILGSGFRRSRLRAFHLDCQGATARISPTDSPR